MAEKDGAWKENATVIGGKDSNKNTWPLNCTTDGTLKVDTTGSGPAEVIVDNVVPVSQSGTWTVTVSNPGGGSTFPISTTLFPALPIGSIFYFQDGLFGVSKGLLLSLTNTPRFTKMLMTSHGGQRIN